MKLIRDLIPLTCEPVDGARFRQATSEELPLLLRGGLPEEVGEVLQALTPELVVAELADVMQVVQEIARTYGVSPSDLDAVRHAKRIRRGGFRAGWILE